MQKIEDFPNGKKWLLMLQKELEALKIQDYRAWFKPLEGDFRGNSFTFGIAIGSREYSTSLSRYDLENANALINLSFLLGDIIKEIKNDMPPDIGQVPTT